MGVTDVAAVAALVVSVLSFIVAVLAARYTRAQARATEVQASEARRIREIEELRDKALQRPDLAAELRTLPGGGLQTVRLTVTLAGPAGTAPIRSLLLRIMADKERSSTLAGGPSPDQIARAVWAPYRFTPRVDGADADGLVADVVPTRQRAGGLHETESIVVQMERTHPPSWWGEDGRGRWNREFPVDAGFVLVAEVATETHDWSIPLPVRLVRDRPRMSRASIGRQ